MSPKKQDRTQLLIVELVVVAAFDQRRIAVTNLFSRPLGTVTPHFSASQDIQDGRDIRSCDIRMLGWQMPWAMLS